MPTSRPSRAGSWAGLGLPSQEVGRKRRREARHPRRPRCGRGGRCPHGAARAEQRCGAGDPGSKGGRRPAHRQPLRSRERRARARAGRPRGSPRRDPRGLFRVSRAAGAGTSVAPPGLGLRRTRPGRSPDPAPGPGLRPRPPPGRPTRPGPRPLCRGPHTGAGRSDPRRQPHSRPRAGPRPRPRSRPPPSARGSRAGAHRSLE